MCKALGVRLHLAIHILILELGKVRVVSAFAIFARLQMSSEIFGCLHAGIFRYVHVFFKKPGTPRIKSSCL